MSGLFKALLPIHVVVLLMYCVFKLLIGCCKRVIQALGGMFTSRLVNKMYDIEENIYTLMSESKREVRKQLKFQLKEGVLQRM